MSTALRGWLQRSVASSSSPTADLYFANACRDFIPFIPGGKWLAPTVFESDRAVLVFRHDAGATVRRDERRRIVYVVDDAIFAGRRDASLPFWYRRKLGLLECEAARRLIVRASDVVVSTPGVGDDVQAIIGARGGTRVAALAPYWSDAFSDLSHFDSAGPVRIGYLASQVHLRNARVVFAVMRAVLSRHPGARFVVPSNHRVPRDLGPPGAVERLPAGPWREYRQRLASSGLHICLYPTGRTAFDRARSWNKLIEHAVIGAAGLYASDWAERHRIADRDSGMVLADRPEDWIAALGRLVQAPGAARRLAVGGQALARQRNDPGPQRHFWRQVLDPR